MSASRLGLILLALALGACGTFGHRGAEADPAIAIRAVLDAQIAAWNRGDIPGFMEGYWQDPKLRFASGGTVTNGWKQTLARYQSRYGDKAAMGTLQFAEIDIQLLGPDSAYAFGQWKLVRAKDQPHGLFTLILRRVGGQWRVIHDHTSSA